MPKKREGEKKNKIIRRSRYGGRRKVLRFLARLAHQKFRVASTQTTVFFFLLFSACSFVNQVVRSRHFARCANERAPVEFGPKRLSSAIVLTRNRVAGCCCCLYTGERALSISVDRHERRRAARGALRARARAKRRRQTLRNAKCRRKMRTRWRQRRRG